MRALIKPLLWLFAGISMLVSVLMALLFLVEVNLYLTQIEQHVSTAFGRKVIIEGPLSLEPSLTPRFVVNGMKITNPEWASRPFLATVDKFDIRVNLLPLLRGDLEIVSLEFHGVDLLLEETSSGTNNFTFGESSEPAALPAIERMSLYDTAIAYAAPEDPVRRLKLEQVSARKVPGQPVRLEAQTSLNGQPVRISLRGEPLDDGHPQGPWQITLLGNSGDLSLQLEGSVADPTDWSQGEYRLELKGQNLSDLETLTSYELPAIGPYELGATIRFELDAYLSVNDLTGQLGSSDIQGNLHWDMSASSPTIKIRLDSQRLDVGELGMDKSLPRSADQGTPEVWDQTLDIGRPGTAALDIQLQVQRLDGLAVAVQDIALTAQADRQGLSLSSARATVDGTQITANASLPWGEPLAPPAAETVSLKTLLQNAELDIRAQAQDAGYRYATTLMGRPTELTLTAVEAKARPGAALTIRAEAALNDSPVTLMLWGEPLETLLQRPSGPWQGLTLEARGDDIRLDATGSLARPLEGEGFDIEYSASGAELYALLPLRGAWSLSGHYAGHPDREVFDDLKLAVGRSDLGGRVVIHREGQRPRLEADIESNRLYLDEILPTGKSERSAAGGWDQPLDIDGLDAFDLNVEAQIGRLEGLAKPLQDILVTALANGQTLTLAPVQATLDGTRLEARAQLPWGPRLAALGKGGVSARGLIGHADLALEAQAPKGKLHYQTVVQGQPVDLGLTGFDASARPGEDIQINARAMLNKKPAQFKLRTEPLAELIKRPTGPWQELTLEALAGDIRFRVTGSVEQPLEAKGFDLRYTLHGAEIAALLPLFNLVLPLEGAYSLSGHFADLPDGVVFDELKIKSGRSDIGGRIRVYQGEQRPRVVANLNSEQIYLRELLPVTDTETMPGAEDRVIPDYDLPIEYMQQFDGELKFKGKRLRTEAGDLGYINFRATLEDGVFRIDPFSVTGWAGALIESDVTIDATQDPPVIALRWIARQLNYGVLLKQAGLGETVEGTIDVTFRLSGTGRTRREFLGDSNGQLVIVGRDGRFGSRRLDLWGSALVTTMLSSQWRREDVTDLNCLVARVSIENGTANVDGLLIDTRRITIGASGTLDLESEQLNLVFAPRPKRMTLLSLTNPVHVTGTIAEPEVALTVLPRNRIRAAGSGVLAGLINPAYLIFTLSQTGSGQTGCAAAINRAMALKGEPDQSNNLPDPPPKRISILPGCAAR